MDKFTFEKNYQELLKEHKNKIEELELKILYMKEYDFEVFDEIYGNVEISESVNPLLKTDHPDSMPYLAWSQELNPNTRSVYIQPGHGPEVYALTPFKQLLKQALKWAAFR
jgi:hypothetical protein